MKLRTALLVLVAVFGMAFVATSQPVYAWSPFGQVQCTGQVKAESAVCGVDGTRGTSNAEDPIAGPNGIILRIADFVALVGGIIAVIIIILAGLRFVTANGSSEDVSGARRSLIYAVVGIVVIVIARLIVQLVLSNI